VKPSLSNPLASIRMTPSQDNDTADKSGRQK